MIYFTSRDKARGFAKGGKKFVDNGATAAGKRWGVKVL